MAFAGKKFLITGGSRGLGRALALAAARTGAEVWAIGRSEADLASLCDASDAIRSLRIDMTDDDAARRAFDAVLPDVLVLCAGATPRMAPVHQQSWQEFSANWMTDVKGSYTFGTAALTHPLTEGSTVVTIASGAAIGGSFASGGYAGAKRMQWFLSNYLQREADELGRGIRFLTILPKQQFRDTELGHAASAGYAKRLGIAQEDFLARFKDALTPDGFADRVLAVLSDAQYADGHTFGIGGAGIERLD